MPIPNKNEKIESISAKRKVYTVLKDWIVEGTLQPGEKLNEGALVDYFGISRTPIREAVMMLESQGLVSVTSGKSTTVTALNFENLEDLYRALMNIQTFTAEQAALKASRAELIALKNLNEQFLIALHSGNVQACVNADYAFHSKLVELAKNKYIVIQSQVLMNHAKRAEIAFFKSETSTLSTESYNDHERLIEAIEKQEPVEAAAIVAQNWLKTLAFIHKV